MTNPALKRPVWVLVLSIILGVAIEVLAPLSTSLRDAPVTPHEFRRPLHALVAAWERDLGGDAWSLFSRAFAGATLGCALAAGWIVHSRDAVLRRVGVIGWSFFIACTAGGVWFLHPVHRATVLEPSEQATLLGGAFAAVAGFLWWRGLDGEWKPRRLAASVVLFGLALLADPTLCFAPLALWALTAYLRRNESTPAAGARGPLVVASILGALALIASFAARTPGGGAPLLPTLFAATTRFARPLRSLVWPFGLHAGYDPPPGWPDEIAPALWVDVATVAALAAACAWGVHRRRGVGYALLAYFALTAGRVLLSREAFGADADGYLASIPLLVGGAVVASRWGDRIGRLAPFAGLAAFVVPAALGCIPIDDARDESSRAAYVLPLDPTNERALVARGDEARRAGARPAAFMSWYQRALDAGDWRPLAHARLGGAYLEIGDASEARRHLERAVEIAPWLGVAQFDLGSLERADGRWEAARRRFEAATRLDPRSVEAWRLLGEAREATGDEAGAREAKNRARELDSDPPR